MLGAVPFVIADESGGKHLRKALNGDEDKLFSDLNVDLFKICYVLFGDDHTLDTVYTYEQISQKEAKALMDSEKDYVILDVRTTEEFAESHIKGAVLIPDYDIKSKAETVLTDKDQLILVYCRSGRRSKNASKELAELGYTNVKEFGGIIDWPYGTVSE